MDKVISAINNISDWLWGTPMLTIMLGGGIFLTLRLDFFQFRYFPYIIRQTFGSVMKKSSGKGTVSPFQAASTALASTAGASNIVGVPIAIAFGGPGAVFWMWTVSLMGCATKFSEIVLGIKYRELNRDKQYVGGPMYYLAKGIPYRQLGKSLSFTYAFFTMIIMAASIAAQSVSAVQTTNVLGISSITTAAALTAIIAIITCGGITRIASVTSTLVPLMAAFYILGAITVILANFTDIPRVFALIFKCALDPSAAVGGAVGSGISAGMRWGIARGTYACEAGMGTAPMAHSAAATDHPVRQGFWGIFEITVSSLIICTLSALVVLTTGLWNQVDPSVAATMPSLAFQTVFGDALGASIVSLSMLLFVISTIIVQVYYGEKQCEFFFGTGISKFLKILYILAIPVGVLGGLELVFAFLDLIIAVTVLPNMLGLVLMSGQVKDLKNDFFGNSVYYRKNTRRSKRSHL